MEALNGYVEKEKKSRMNELHSGPQKLETAN